MNASPDLIRELQASRPTAPAQLRARVREIAAQERSAPARSWLRIPVRRAALVALPAAAALALVSAGALGLVRSGPITGTETFGGDTRQAETFAESSPTGEQGAATATDSAIVPTPGRAQRVSATLTVEVRDADAVSRAAQEALELTRSLGGHVVSASVFTGEEGNAVLTVRIPVAEVQDAIVQLSALGRITSQQVTIDDLQETLDGLTRRGAILESQIARIRARLAAEALEPQTEAVLRARLHSLREELAKLRGEITATTTQARMATVQLTLVTPGAQGAAPLPSRLDRTLDEALNVLVWEGVVALALAIVLTPFAILAAAAWLGRRLYRRREDERLLTAS
jgi:hypothetical protein